MALMQDAGVLAIQFDDVGVVRDQDEGSVLALMKQLDVTSFVKASVADHHRLVDQETIEFDRHRQCKGEARQHSVGVMQYWLSKVDAELGEFLNKRYQRLVIDSVHAADELQIVETGQVGLESATECQRPGDMQIGRASCR